MRGRGLTPGGSWRWDIHCSTGDLTKVGKLLVASGLGSAARYEPRRILRRTEG